MKKLIFLGIFTLCSIANTWAEEATENKGEWKQSGNAALQITQGYVSKNWYKGGESNFTLLATGQMDVNYTKGKFAWDNKFEAKLGFVTTPSDEFHDYMTNQDLMKWTTKFGYKAANNWYYTLQGIGMTQFCRGYKVNKEEIFSEFLSPAYVNVALGMDYKKETEKFKITAFIGPLAYNLKYVNNPLRYAGYDDAITGEPVIKGKIDGTQFGLRHGQYNTYDMGASAKVNTKWNICKYVSWESNATYFSPLYGIGKDGNDGYTEIMWENTFDMPLNKFFSTKIYTCLRFDDSVGPENKGAGWNYFQFTELLSFGLSYKW